MKPIFSFLYITIYISYYNTFNTLDEAEKGFLYTTLLTQKLGRREFMALTFTLVKLLKRQI